MPAIMIEKGKLSEMIKHEAKVAGFDGCGLVEATFLSADAPHLEKWLKNQYQGSMSYMERHFDKRLDPRLLVPGTKTVISLIFDYNIKAEQNIDAFYEVAQYARLYDYHFFLKEKMRAMVNTLRKKIGDFQAEVFTDSAPILERAWAIKAGLGMRGKHSQLIIPKLGSMVLLCQILTDLVPAYDNPLKNTICDSCRRCIEACPGKAINEDYTIDARKCISYLTIEHKGDENYRKGRGITKQIFGCDICQKVCPLNPPAKDDTSEIPLVNYNLLSLAKTDWENLDKKTFKAIFKQTPLYRTGLDKIKRNMISTNV